MKRIPFILGGSIGAAVVSMYCAPFGSDDVAPPDAQATSDAGPDVSSAGDAAAADAGPCASPDCEGFDVAGWESNWQLNGSPIASGGHFVSAPSSLLVAASSSGTTFIHRDLPTGPRKITVRLMMKIVTVGDGEVDLFGLRMLDDAGDATAGVYLVRTFTTYAIQYPGEGGPKFFNFTPKLTEWTPVSFTVDETARAFSYTVGDQTGKQTLPASYTPQRRTLEVGARFVRSINKPWELRYDDVRVILE